MQPPKNSLESLELIARTISLDTIIFVNRKFKGLDVFLLESIKNISKMFEVNNLTLHTLRIVVKILKNEAISSTESAYQRGAQKIIKFYNANQKKSILVAGVIKNFEIITFNVEAQFCHLNVQHAYNQHKILRDSITSWIEKFPTIDTHEIIKFLENIENANGHTSDSSDIFRYLMAGMIKLLENNNDIFKINRVAISNLAGISDPVEELNKFIERLKVLLDFLKGKATYGMTNTNIESLNLSIENLLSLIKEIDPDHLTLTLQRTFDAWRSGTDGHKNLCRLLCAANQKFHMTVMEKATLGLLVKYPPSDNPKDPVCPNKLVGLNNAYLALDKNSREIIYTFNDDKILIEHKATLKQTGVPGFCFVLQTTSLKSSLSDLTKWECEVKCDVFAPNESDQTIAFKLWQIYKNAGISSFLHVNF